MKKEEIIQTLKNNYNRDLRKQVVKTILTQEKKNNPNYDIINQIFSYVLKELDWKISDNIEKWDYTPLDIMEKAFPKLESSKWFEEQIISAKKMMEK